MGISYDPGSKKWNVVYEPTNYKWDYETNHPITSTVSYTGSFATSVYYEIKGGARPNNRDLTVTVPLNATEKEIREALEKAGALSGSVPGAVNNNMAFYTAVKTIQDQYETINNTNKINSDLNASNKSLNLINMKLNSSNATKNKAYDTTVAVAAGTKGGDYVQQRELIRNLRGVDDIKKTLEDYFKAFYTTEKLQTWDSNLGAKPPYGDFDADYYKQQNPAAAQQWASAVANDDIDITQRYGEINFYLSHYTNIGKPAGARGNPVERKIQVEQYKETAPTDNDLQLVRSLQLGVDTDSQTQRLISVPEVAGEWDKAKKGDNYWKQLGKQYFLDVNKPDEFAALFRLSERPEDKQVAFNYNANTGYGITELEDALNQAVGEKAGVDVKKFGALTQDVLRQTIDEMKKAKAREQEIAMFSGFGAFSEIMDINKELSNSILGDTGVGGVLSFMGGGKAEESLEKSLRGITGVNNNTVYNWQKWFDETLKKRYEQDIELGLSSSEAKEKIRIEGEFARDFLDKYLIPRFDESRSMNEFVEYLDVRQSEQNPFQTQDIMNAAKLVADLRANQFLDQLKQTPERYFDSVFYFNPTGDKAREEAYARQAQTVSEDWEAAKRGDQYWASQAYRFGVDVNDKNQFARMHFQVKGQGQGFDGADDILNASKVSDYIYTQILPALKEEALKQRTVFGQFIKPDEFADEMLRGLDPNDKSTWDEVLKRYGLDDFKGTIEELKQYIAEALRTGSAQEIRENIKYLNEKRQKPTQQILGVTYIEREEDYKDEMAKPRTELFKVFQSAGFQGTEDDFYENFFPDVDRSEQAFLTKAGKGEALKTEKLDFSDPFASLGTIESFFGDDEDDKKDKKTDTTFSSSYFRLDGDDYRNEKSKSGQSFLGEFTSMFKL